MGQIWDRISRIARATFNESSAIGASERIIRSDDDELRRIIEDLSSQKTGRQDEKQLPSTEYSDRNDEMLGKAAKILGVAIDASPESITTAYRRKILQVHPDRVTMQNKEAQEAARQKTIELNDAYKLFRDVKGF